MYNPINSYFLARSIVFVTLCFLVWLIVFIGREAVLSERPRIAIVQYSDKYYPDYKGAIESVRCYARRHGYSYILENRRHTNDVFFERMLRVQKEFENFDVILALEVDMFIANLTKRIEEYLIPGVDVYFSQRLWLGNEVAAGYHLIRVTDFSKTFYSRWMAFNGERRCALSDNGALMMLLTEYFYQFQGSELKKLQAEYDRIPNEMPPSPATLTIYFDFLKNVRSSIMGSKGNIGETKKIKVSASLHGFARDLEMHLASGSSEFWTKLLPEDFIIHTKKPYMFVGESVMCDSSYNGPVFVKEHVFSSRDEAMRLFTQVIPSLPEARQYIEHIPGCYPHCPDFWVFPQQI